MIEYATLTPAAQMRKPPTAGPTTLVTLTAVMLNAIAFVSRRRPTTSATIAFLAGMTKGKTAPTTVTWTRMCQ